MNPLDRIAERKLQEAVESGAFDDFPGKGEPLELEDLSGLDPELRASYLLLKGHGFISEEQTLRHDVIRLEALLRACRDDGERQQLREESSRKRLRFALLLEQRGVSQDVIERLCSALRER